MMKGWHDMRTVLSIVRALGLHDFKKSYCDPTGADIPFPNLKILPDCEVIWMEVDYEMKTVYMQICYEE